MTAPTHRQARFQIGGRPLRELLARPPLWILLCACTAILYLRRPDAFINPQFWAEDFYFFMCDYTMRLGAIFLPYSGYLHLLPRLIATAGSLLDPLWIPTFYVFCAFALTLYVAARTQSARMPFPQHAAFALAVVLVPDAPETLLNVTNVQFILAGGLALALISNDPRSRREYVHDIAAVLLLGLTGPFSIAFAPFFLARAWQRRTAASGILAALAIAAGAVQLVVFKTHPMPDILDAKIEPEYALGLPGARIGGSLFLGRFFPDNLSWQALTLAGVATIALAACLALSIKQRRTEALILAACCLVVMASTVFRQRFYLHGMTHAGVGSRYIYPPQMFVLWLLLWAWRSQSALAWPSLALLAAFLFCNVPRLREPAFQDMHWADYAPKIRAGEEVVVPVNPGGQWKFTLPAKKKN